MLTNFVQLEREYGFVEREGLTLAEIVDFPTNKNGGLDAIRIAAEFAKLGHYTAPCGTRFMSMDTLMLPENSWRLGKLSDYTNPQRMTA